MQAVISEVFRTTIEDPATRLRRRNECARVKLRRLRGWSAEDMEEYRRYFRKLCTLTLEVAESTAQVK
ncbi:MAG: hypothetical protein ACE14S_01510 [Candidatus Bathyarchaeia archaeon]